MTYRGDNPYQITGDILYPLRVVWFIGLLVMGYMLSKPEEAITGKDGLLMDTGAIDSSDPLPWQKKASEKAIQRYTASQEKQWRRWNESMFERKR